MLSTFQSVLSKALRSGGQSLDSLGRTFELFPYIEKCKFIFFLLFIGCDSLNVVFVFYSSFAVYPGQYNRQQGQSNLARIFL